MRSVRNLMMWFVCLLLMVGPVLGSALDSMDERFDQRSYRRFLLPNGLKILLIYPVSGTLLVQPMYSAQREILFPLRWLIGAILLSKFLCNFV